MWKTAEGAPAVVSYDVKICDDMKSFLQVSAVGIEFGLFWANFRAHLYKDGVRGVVLASEAFEAAG